MCEKYIALTFSVHDFLNSFFCWLLFCFILMSSLFLGMGFCSRLLWVWLSIYLTLLSVHRHLLSLLFFFLKDTHCVWSEFKIFKLLQCFYSKSLSKHDLTRKWNTVSCTVIFVSVISKDKKHKKGDIFATFQLEILYSS